MKGSSWRLPFLVGVLVTTVIGGTIAGVAIHRRNEKRIDFTDVTPIVPPTMPTTTPPYTEPWSEYSATSAGFKVTWRMPPAKEQGSGPVRNLNAPVVGTIWVHKNSTRSLQYGAALVEHLDAFDGDDDFGASQVALALHGVTTGLDRGKYIGGRAVIPFGAGHYDGKSTVGYVFAWHGAAFLVWVGAPPAPMGGPDQNGDLARLIDSVSFTAA